MTLAIIDSGGANISSVKHALRRLGADPVFTSDKDIIRKADKVILPGVGAAGAAMSRLQELDLISCIRSLQQPVLGICLGMQLLFESSEEDQGEDGNMQCLGLIPGALTKLEPSEGIRIPHMGWNTTSAVKDDLLMSGISESSWFYFVHSFCAPMNEYTIASCTHGEAFAAVVRRGNFCGAQFHPERSARNGSRLLANFLETS